MLRLADYDQSVTALRIMFAFQCVLTSSHKGDEGRDTYCNYITVKLAYDLAKQFSKNLGLGRSE